MGCLRIWCNILSANLYNPSTNLKGVVEYILAEGLKDAVLTGEPGALLIGGVKTMVVRERFRCFPEGRTKKDKDLYNRVMGNI